MMTDIPLTNILAFALIFASAIAIITNIRFYRVEKRKSQKYEFYRLRSKLHKMILEADNPDEFDELDAYLTSLITNLQDYPIGFSFFNGALERACDNLVQIYKDQGEIGLSKHFEQMLADKSPQRTIQSEIFVLLVQTARKNSILLEIAMTELGYSFFVRYHLFRALLKRLATDHKRGNVAPTVEVYSVMGRCLTSKLA